MLLTDNGQMQDALTLIKFDVGSFDVKLVSVYFVTPYLLVHK